MASSGVVNAEHRKYLTARLGLEQIVHRPVRADQRHVQAEIGSGVLDGGLRRGVEAGPVGAADYNATTCASERP